MSLSASDSEVKELTEHVQMLNDENHKGEMVLNSVMKQHKAVAEKYVVTLY